MRPLQNCYIQINSLSHQQGPIASADDVRNTCPHRVFYDADKINSKIKVVHCKVFFCKLPLKATHMITNSLIPILTPLTPPVGDRECAGM